MIKIIVAVILSFVAGMVFTLCAIKKKKKHRKKKVSLDTFSKIITTCVIAHGMVLTTWSYILACFSLDPVVDVSSTIVKEIVAPVVVYLATNMIMNIFEKNKLSFSVPLSSTVISKDDEGKYQTFFGTDDSGAQG